MFPKMFVLLHLRLFQLLRALVSLPQLVVVMLLVVVVLLLVAMLLSLLHRICHTQLLVLPLSVVLLLMEGLPLTVYILVRPIPFPHNFMVLFLILVLLVQLLKLWMCQMFLWVICVQL